MLACMPTCLLDNSTIILSLMVVKSLNPYFIFQNCVVFLHSYQSHVSILFFCVRADLLYRYRFSVCLPISCIGTVFLYRDIFCAYYLPCYYLTLDSCMLLTDTCLISLITCHLIHYCLPCDYHISRILSCYPVFYIQ